MEFRYSTEEPKNLIGKRVRELRLKNGMSQTTLVYRLKQEGMRVNMGSVGRIEHQIRPISDIEVAILAKVLGVTIEQLFR